jgi:hypothetical protein
MSTARRRPDFGVYPVPGLCGDGKDPEVSVVVEGRLFGGGKFATEEPEETTLPWVCDYLVGRTRTRLIGRGVVAPCTRGRGS